MAFHPLAVESVRQLTADAIEVAFAVPDELAGEFDYRPGQCVVLRALLDGEDVRRNYSLCHAPEPGRIVVAVKRERGGLFSTWALENVAPGLELDVLVPDGRFTLAPPKAPGGPRHFAAVAAGSGITPVLALIESTLAGSEADAFTLVYSNKTAFDAMFVDELADLKDRYPARFSLVHVLTRELRSSELMSGRLDAAKVRRLVTELVRPETIDQWFLCGPEDLVDVCRAELLAAGVEPAAITRELFTAGRPARPPRPPRPPAERDAEAAAEVHTVSVKLDGTTFTATTPVHSNEPILHAALRVRKDVPYGCAGGVCGTCRARLVEGEAEMIDNYALDPEEVARGLILTCQAVPVTPSVAVDYDTI
jgi:ring-1,2-phenylacetyl-CoA epoxidase subunit PaaE